MGLELDSRRSSQPVLGVFLMEKRAHTMNVVKSIAILTVIGLSVFDPVREMLIALLTPRVHHAAPVVMTREEALKRGFVPYEKGFLWSDGTIRTTSECPNSPFKDADGDPRCLDPRIDR